MEALLERGTDVENWNDERLDELSGRMDAGFKEMRDGFARIDKRFERSDERIAGLATRQDFQNLEARLFRTLLTLLVVFGGVISTLVALNAS